MKIEIKFYEPLLGTMSGNKEIFEEFIASKNPKGIQEDEIESVPELTEEIKKCSTVFARDKDNKPILWDYHIKGYFKEACKAMIDSDTIAKKELQQFRLTDYLHKRTIDKLIFIAPRRIKLILPENEKLVFCERPLRGQTMRGERIALARSEEAPAGTKLNCEIILLNGKLMNFVKRWLDYGVLSGLGQWRNSGKGRFEWKEII